MSRSSLLLAPVLALLIPACGSSEAAAPAPVGPGQAQAQPASTGDAKALCVEVFTRNRTCTDQYIPALVDLRAKYDQPAGIAAEVAANRADVIARARTEWATDSLPEAIDATCTKLAGSVGEADQAGIQACLADQDCTAYTSCVMPFFEKRFAK